MKLRDLKLSYKFFLDVFKWNTKNNGEYKPYRSIKILKNLKACEKYMTLIEKELDEICGDHKKILKAFCN